MIRIALIYGAIAGSVVIASMIMGFIASDNEGAFSSAVFGYLIMLVALTMIFVGVKRYRDRDLGGVIKFGPAFGLGLMIAAVAAIIYVAGWEVYLGLTDHAFIHEYANSAIEAKKAAGVTGEALEKTITQMAELVKNYGNPFYRMPMTFAEIFPVGLLVALVSAALLRNPKVLPARG